MKIILASKSPRREQLMYFLTDDFLVIPSDFPERDVSYNGDPGGYCEELALKKALAVAKDFSNDAILGSDTVVFIDGTILNKPRNRSDARAMMEKMQGRTHEVLTAYAIVVPRQGIEIVDHVTTKVVFSNMSPAEIESYLDEEDHMGKAGAYAVQGAAAKFVESVDGDYYNVVGHPVAKLYKELKGLGILS